VLRAAAERLRPFPEARSIETLVHTGRVADAAALADPILIEAD